MSLPEIELWSSAFKANAYAAYARARATSAVVPVVLPNGMTVWMIVRYDAAVASLRDPRLVSDPRRVLPPDQLVLLRPTDEDGTPVLPSMLALDPPDHTRLRGLVSKAFTPRTVERLRPRVQQVADALIDRMIERGGTHDLIDEFAFPLPMTVIAELLGIPPEGREQLRTWTAITTGSLPDEQYGQRIAEATRQFNAYLASLFAERRARPQDDLISALLQAEEAGDTLSERELYANVALLIIAGHETTVNLIGNGIVALLTHPDQLALLRARPELIEPAVEELLRFDGPVDSTAGRFAAEDIELEGVTIPRGAPVLAVLTSANRDERRFPEPDRLDITRADNRHIAFGYGIHYCIGAPLARLEGQIAINTLLRRLPELRLAVRPEELVYRPSLTIRGLEQVPIAF